MFDAVEKLLLEHPGDLPTIPAIAETAGINPTSLYRRWGDIRRLAGEVAVERLMREHPMPDTGSLREDLIGWAAALARSISTRSNVMLLRILTAVPAGKATAGNLAAASKSTTLAPRIRELQTMLNRGRGRGEAVPSVIDVFELVLAPIYLHALFLGPLLNPDGVARLVDRALLLAQAGGTTAKSSARR